VAEDSHDSEAEEEREDEHKMDEAANADAAAQVSICHIIIHICHIIIHI